MGIRTTTRPRKELLKLVSKYRVQYSGRCIAYGQKEMPLCLPESGQPPLSRWFLWKMRDWGSVLLPHGITWWLGLSCHPGDQHTWILVLSGQSLSLVPHLLLGYSDKIVQGGIPSIMTTHDRLCIKNFNRNYSVICWGFFLFGWSFLFVCLLSAAV